MRIAKHSLDSKIVLQSAVAPNTSKRVCITLKGFVNLDNVLFKMYMELAQNRGANIK